MYGWDTVGSRDQRCDFSQMRSEGWTACHWMAVSIWLRALQNTAGMLG